jgi:hypothetical protein
MKKLSFLGDVYLDEKYDICWDLDNYVFNLEYPISSRGTPAKNKINLIQSKSYIKETFGKFPVAVNLANNHIMDYGEEAFEDTIKFLEKNNIKYFGTGNKINNFNNPCILDLNGKTIALFGYSCKTTNALFGNESNNGSALLDLKLIKNDIKNCDADFKIIQLHWGMEDVPFPTYDDTQKSKQIIDFGADMIIGHHAHTIQPVLNYKGKGIFYGLGNCIFPDFNMKSYFNGEQFTKRSKKKQLRHNKRSIKINLDENCHYSYSCLEFKDGKLHQMTKNIIPKFIPLNNDDFKRKFIKDERKKMIFRFIKKPKIINFLQIKRFLGVSK